jgi:hypothetical protein
MKYVNCRLASSVILAVCVQSQSHLCMKCPASGTDALAYKWSFGSFSKPFCACSLQRGLRPHNYCLPILKRERHREAVAAAATSGSRKFFLGTDSAPHARHTKEAPCGCAGVYSAPIALALYATAFEQVSVGPKGCGKVLSFRAYS